MVFSTYTADSDCPNHLKQNFNPSAPNQVWVSDITYIPASNRFCYLCTVIDLFARKVIAYWLSPKMKVQLTIGTFQAAWNNRGKPVGLLFHSDHGSQYTAKEFRKLLDGYDVVQSFSAKGNPYDNAMAENFFSILKTQRNQPPNLYILEPITAFAVYIYPFLQHAASA